MLRMVIFLTVFLSIYAGMHLLVRWGVQPLWQGFPSAGRWFGLWMLLMVPAPILVRVLERVGLESGARLFSLIAYVWMGLLFLAFAGFVVVGLWELLVRLAEQVAPTLPLLSIYGLRCTLLVLFLSLAGGLYGLYEAASLRVERVRIESDKLPAKVAPLRIVQISDLHLGLLLREGALERVVTAVAELEPDVIVATGDIVDAEINHLDGLSQRFASLQPPLGKYAVTGNHEYYAGLKPALDFLGRSGFTVLRNSARSPRPGLVLAGVDDPVGGGGDEQALLPPAPRDFTVLLKHRPLVADGSLGRFDLQLSGHAHRGQIFPFNLLTGLTFPMQDGLYRLGGGSWLYTSRGTGTWGPPMRLFSPPEITLFEIVGTGVTPGPG